MLCTQNLESSMQVRSQSQFQQCKRQLHACGWRKFGRCFCIMALFVLRTSAHVLYLTHSAEAPEAKFRRRNSLDEGCDALSVYTKAIPIENGYDFRCARALTAAPRPLVAPRRPGHVWIHVWIQTHEHGPPLGFKLMSRGDP